MVVPSARTQVEWGARVLSQRSRVPAYVLIIYIASMNIVYYILTYSHSRQHRTESENQRAGRQIRHSFGQTPSLHVPDRRQRLAE